MTTFEAKGADFVASPSDWTTVIAPRRRSVILDFQELRRYRDLLRYLAWRDICVRYKQTALGAGWALIQPIALMVVFTAVFGRGLGVSNSIDVPYPIFVYAGLLPWTFFREAVNASSNSLVKNAGMLTKIYFPRILMPAAAFGAPLIDYAVAFGVLVVMMLWYGMAQGAELLLLPLLVVSTMIAALGVGLILSAMTVSYRDFRHIIPFLLQVWLFLTPVIYPLDLPAWDIGPVDLSTWLVDLNPMSGTIRALRAAVVGEPIIYARWLTSLGSSLALLVLGLTWFSRSERYFADIV